MGKNSALIREQILYSFKIYFLIVCIKKNHHMKYSFIQYMYMIGFGILSNLWLQQKIILPQIATKKTIEWISKIHLCNIYNRKNGKLILYKYLLKLVFGLILMECCNIQHKDWISRVYEYEQSDVKFSPLLVINFENVSQATENFNCRAK